MPRYFSQFLYISDPFGQPVELFNGARLARNLEAAGQCGVFSNVLANAGCDALVYQPGMPAALSDTMFWIDAVDGTNTRQYAPNRGQGGQLLNALEGSTSGVDSTDPLWLGGAERYLYTPAVAGNYASVPDTAVLDITGDIELIVRVAMDDWTPSAAQTLLSKYTAASHGYELQLNTAGTLSLICRLAASDVTATSSVAPTVADGNELWLRATRASASGNVNFYTATTGPDVPLAWAQLGTANVATTAGAIAVGANAVRVMERPAGTQSAGGKMFRAIIRNVIDAVTPVNVADLNFTLNTSQSSFVATAGGTVTITRSSTGRKSVAYQGRPVWLFGTDDFFNVPDTTGLLDFAVNESFTVLAVQRTHNVAVGAIGAIVAKQTGSTTQGWGLYNGTAATSSFDVADGAVSPDVATGNKTAATNHVIVGVRNTTTDTVAVYLDGTLSNSTTDTNTLTSANAQPMRIGSFSAGASPLDAEIMAVIVWRRALSATEIAQVSNFYRSAPVLAGNCWSAVDFSTTQNPWYNANVAASTEAYGFLIEEWTGLDGAHHRRSSSPTGQNRGGAWYGPQSHDARTWAMNVVLHGSTERGLTYLFRWLEQRLLAACDPSCGARKVWLREFCPPNPETNPEEGVARAERVVLMGGPTWESEPIADMGCFLRRVSFTLGVGDPCLYSEPLLLTTNVSTTTGVTTAATQTQPGIFDGSQLQSRADFTGQTVPYGVVAPIVTITSPSEYSTSGRKGLPVMRIAGYADPNLTGSPTRSIFLGELILEGYESSGYEIEVDMVQRRVRMRGLGAVEWEDGSRFIGPALRSGVPRWWSFADCTTGFVIVEPALVGLGTNRTPVTSLQVSTWTTRIEVGQRWGCV